ncbi:MAG: secretin N-terminal domain-containing protein [Pyrinomonadaceae bacterium]
MKHSAHFRFSITLFLLLALLSPTIALAGGDGKKHFKEGMKAENAEQWDKAVEEFALAVVDDPKNPEYRLHYQRSIFNASQMYMKRGTSLAEQKDYAGGYLAFRKAYAYDPTNQLAESEMERMLRLQKSLDGGESLDVKTNSNGDVRLVPTGYQKQDPRDDLVPQRLEKYQDVPFPGGIDLQYLIKELAKNLDLNVLFDVESFRQKREIKIELKNVTPAKALDYIFLQEGLFFQKVGPRTILVAIQNRRQQFQQLVLRTFYLANADPAEVSKLISTAIPVQPGRTPTTTLVDKSTNSITVRDTEENIRLIGKLIGSLDKDRAEVVMDVAIYEVSKTDLLKFGNQIGNSSTLTNLGGTTSGAVGNDNFGRMGRAAAEIIPRAFGVGLVIPAINLVALQSRSNTKLIASTQIHAFNNEDSSARIGQRVPVRSATISNGFGGGGNTQPGGGGNSFVGDVINYEQVGLTLKFKPIVFPNQDVQVAMEIESKDVLNASLNPTFSERTIKGTARIQNNKTLLLASVAQGSESNGREGLPLLGLIPIIGRLFTAPTKDNRQVDVVIAVTPRVIRAPAILPEDEMERPTGSLAVPTTNSLEAMIIREEVEEQLAAARRLPTVAKVQLQDQQPEAPVYVKSNSGQPSGTSKNTAQNQNVVSSPKAAEDIAPSVTNLTSTLLATNLRPIDTSVKTLQITPTALISAPKKFEILPSTSSNVIETATNSSAPVAEITFAQTLPKMKVREKTKIPVLVKSGMTFRSAVMALKFNSRKLAIRDISFGEVFGSGLAQTKMTPFLNQNGKMFVSLSASKDASEFSSGILAYIEVEALADGKHEIEFDPEAMNLLTADGKNFIVRF